MQEFASYDPRVPVALGNNKLIWLSDYEYFDDAFRKKDRFYQDFMVPRKGGESLVATLAKEASRLGIATVMRNVAQEKMPEPTRKAMDIVAPHLDRPMKLSRRFAAIASEAILGDRVLDALNEPLAFAMSNGRLHRANVAFEETLRSGHVLSNEQGVLRVHLPELNPQFLRAVRECCRLAEGGNSGDQNAQFTIRIDQVSGLPAFITMAPLAAVHLKSWAGRPCALIRIDEPGRAPATQKLIDALGLSAVEARLVSALCGGGSLADTAERVGVSLNTAKSQLSSAFSKIGTTRQSELVALVTALARKR
jgi:DNA-binding CsgD family transcriptional regulator